MTQVLRELKEPQLTKLSQTEFQVSRHGWELSEQFHHIRRERPQGLSDVVVNTLAIKYFSDHWEAGATHNLICQKRDPNLGRTRFEDNVGPSYLKYQIQMTSGLLMARAGDDSVEWGKGQLLSASAGRLRQQLFGFLLDPTVVLTTDSPKEIVPGANFLSYSRFEGDRATKHGVRN